MSRTKSAPRARKAPVVTQMAWIDAHKELFRIACAFGAPPRKVEVTHHSVGWTFKGRFQDVQGRTVVGVVRVRKTRDGKLRVIEERMSIRFGFRLGSKAEAA